jgi:NitT/TauT family transport system permease protein
MNGMLKRIWGEASALLERPGRFNGIDLLLLAGVAGLLYHLLGVAKEWSGEMHTAVQIDLSFSALPMYVLYSAVRGLVAYLFSLVFSIAYGYWAAKDAIAEKALVPLLDILQSIPVLGFMPALVIALIAVFPHSNLGLELAAVLMIFTGQVWNMTFSFYYSMKSVPRDLREVSSVYGFSWWRRFTGVELPSATVGLVWNSMMSMAGGWFFLMINESFVLGSKDFRLPGIGSYMSVAVAHGDVPAMLAAAAGMMLMIFVIDQLLWRPVVVWAQKFRIEDSAVTETSESWFLNLLRVSRVLSLLGTAMQALRSRGAQRKRRVIGVRAVAGKLKLPSAPLRVLGIALRWITLLVPATAMVYGAVSLGGLLREVQGAEWLRLAGAAGLTLSRVLAATALGTLWAVPAGLAIGLSPTLSRRLQPVVQMMASFPAPMLFPAAVWLLAAMHLQLDFGSVVLMLLGTQWYILFNVIAGAMSIPADLREAVFSFRIGGWRRMRTLYLPAIFPSLVTGWVTAAGGAWNASIVSEYVQMHGAVLRAEGLGALIATAAEHADFPVLAAGVVAMAAVVVTFNRLVWRRMYRVASERYSLNR